MALDFRAIDFSNTKSVETVLKIRPDLANLENYPSDMSAKIFAFAKLLNDEKNTVSESSGKSDETLRQAFDDVKGITRVGNAVERNAIMSHFVEAFTIHTTNLVEANRLGNEVIRCIKLSLDITKNDLMKSQAALAESQAALAESQAALETIRGEHARAAAEIKGLQEPLEEALHLPSTAARTLHFQEGSTPGGGGTRRNRRRRGRKSRK
jgi:hypothetical protein